MAERLLLPSPERQANTKTTQDNYPPLVHFVFHHTKREQMEKKGKKTSPMCQRCFTATAVQGLLSNDGYNPREILDQFVANGL